ncbi:DUF397 domain-containing protein [Streptomyces pseudogriseolus]|uniref:DUF397 domain-containing protein n=1 Tax=Streptomyces pseudogriseolus TaxID=36817 RepID=UPI003498FE23
MSAESTRLTWQKSSYSGNEGGACVEVTIDTSVIHIRDSKDVDRPSLSVHAHGWATFVAFAAAG